MLKRVISGAIVAIVAFIFGIIGGAPLAIFLATCSCIAYVEYTTTTQVRQKGHRFNGLQTIGLVTIIGYYILLLLQDKMIPVPDSLKNWADTTVGAFNYYTILLLLVFTVGVIFILGAYIFAYPRFNNNQVANAVFGIIYVGVMLSFVYYLRNLDHGIYLVWIAFIPAWVCDTCAYFVGSAIGKHKLCPNLSPKKSIEGSIGGIVGAGLVGAFVGFLYMHFVSGRMLDLFVFIIVCMVGACASQCGDLAASAVKRNNDVKDYGKIIPGHGGIMDRFDSLIITAPIVYFFMVLFLQL